MSELMSGKVVVITGATSGIGQRAAERLAAMGARMLMVARDRARGEATLQKLREISPGVQHTIHYADLEVIAEMKRVGAEIAQVEPRIDVLVNNAGAMFGSFQKTSDGLEKTFALNHISYFVLTHALLERLKASAPSRIVSTSSDAHSAVTLDFDDLQSEKAYAGKFGSPGFKVYSRSKLANILFTRELARRLSGTGVTANCLHPGFVNTRFGDEAGGAFAAALRLGKKFALTPDQGSDTLVYLASSQDVAGKTGLYFVKCKEKTPSKAAQDDDAARKLWAVSENLAGIKYQ